MYGENFRFEGIVMWRNKGNKALAKEMYANHISLKKGEKHTQIKDFRSV
jgi:hypothetical protein